MIPNTAQNSFWMFRYAERGEIAAQMLLSAHLSKLETHPLTSKEDKILLALAPENNIFSQLYPHKESDNELVQDFLTWQEVNPSSLYNVFKNAREGAKLIRNVIGRAIWNAINELYVWQSTPEAKKLYTGNRQLFYQRFLQASQRLKGGFYNSLSQDLYYQLMELGMRLERAYQSLRNVTYLQGVGLNRQEPGREISCAQEFHLTRFLLECNSSTDCYLKGNYGLDIPSCIDFFLFEKSSPRSLAHNIDHISRVVSCLKMLSPESFPQALNSTLEKCNLVHTLQIKENAWGESMCMQQKILCGLSELGTLAEKAYCLPQR